MKSLLRCSLPLLALTTGLLAASDPIRL